MEPVHYQPTYTTQSSTPNLHNIHNHHLHPIIIIITVLRLTLVHTQTSLPQPDHNHSQNPHEWDAQTTEPLTQIHLFSTPKASKTVPIQNSHNTVVLNLLFSIKGSGKGGGTASITDNTIKTKETKLDNCSTFGYHTFVFSYNLQNTQIPILFYLWIFWVFIQHSLTIQ